jgi:hypothetical protein
VAFGEWALISPSHRAYRSAILSTAAPFLHARDLSFDASVSPRLVESIAMINTEDGFGLASRTITTNKPQAPVELVRTSNGGAWWRAQANLPWRKQWTGLPFFYVDPYVDEQVGSQLMVLEGDIYVTNPLGTKIYVSSNDGSSWHRLQFVGRLSGAAVVGRDLWVTTSRCTKLTATSDRCDSYLLTLRRGELRPRTQERIPGSTETALVEPTLGPGPRYYRQALLINGVGTGSGIFTDGNTVGLTPATLWMTDDAGTTWRPLPNPCHQLLVSALVTTPADRWVLYCSLDGGMNQGTNELFSSSNDGVTWNLFAAANEGRNLHVGHFDDGMSAVLQSSGNGVDLWQELSVGPFLESDDGGLTWHLLADGPRAQAPIDTLGASAAWVVQPGFGIWRTINGTTWTLLR